MNREAKAAAVAAFEAMQFEILMGSRAELDYGVCDRVAGAGKADLLVDVVLQHRPKRDHGDGWTAYEQDGLVHALWFRDLLGEEQLLALQQFPKARGYLPTVTSDVKVMESAVRGTSASRRSALGNLGLPEELKLRAVAEVGLRTFSDLGYCKTPSRGYLEAVVKRLTYVGDSDLIGPLLKQLFEGTVGKYRRLVVDFAIETNNLHLGLAGLLLSGRKAGTISNTLAEKACQHLAKIARGTNDGEECRRVVQLLNRYRHIEFHAIGVNKHE